MVNDEFSTNKAHAAWFMQRACYPMQDANPAKLEEFWKTQKDSASTWGTPWECLGPFDVAGRVTALVHHPTDFKLLYAGSANGGVWRSRDAGATWESRWLRWANPAIGALALDPQDPQTIYAATGEANLSPDCYPGSGIYLSRDGADTWELFYPASGNAAVPRRIGALCPNPYRPGEIYLGGYSKEEPDTAGFYSKASHGLSFVRDTTLSSRSYNCHSIVCHPDGSVFAAVNCGGLQTGVYRIAGGKWRQRNVGLPSAERIGRIALGIAPSRPNTLYALVVSRGGRHVAGLFATDDAGSHWREISGGQFAHERTPFYNVALAVHPDDRRTVVCGVSDIHITRDAGASWTRASHWDARPARPEYVHADQHAILLPGGDLIYSANDGGVSASEDFGKNWSRRVQGMVTTMFYDIDVSPQNAGLVGGGAQDNGCMLLGAPDAQGKTLSVAGGDGVWVVFDPHHPERAYLSRSNIHIRRHTRGRHWAEKTWSEATPRGMLQAEHNQNAIAVVAMNPERSGEIWTGSTRLWRTPDGGRHWQSVSPFFDGGAITAIEVRGDLVLAGTQWGGLYRSRDGGETWTDSISGPNIPERVISRIETHPLDPKRIVVTVASRGAGVTAAHIFYSEDGGDTWRIIDGQGIPDVAHHAAIFETRRPYRLFIANDCGVWMSGDLAKWTDITGGLPTVMVADLVYHHESRMLYAGTYGRGIWRVQVPR